MINIYARWISSTKLQLVEPKIPLYHRILFKKYFKNYIFTYEDLCFFKKNNFKLIILNENNFVIKKIIIYSNNIKIICSEQTKSLLTEYFKYYNDSMCFERGYYDITKRKLENSLIFRNGSNILPIGYKKDLFNFCRKNKIKIIQKEIKYTKYNFTLENIENCLGYITLYDYQVKAIQKSLRCQHGIVKLTTSAGKTEIFLALCKLTGLKTLIITNRIKLAQQTYKRANLAGLDAGICQSSNLELDHKIIISTIQSISKINIDFEMVIIDECHYCNSSEYQRLLRKKFFQIRLGFSATPFHKKVYKDKLIKNYLGDIIYTVPASKLISENRILEPVFYMHKIKNKIDDRLNWFLTEKKGIIEHTERNDKIIALSRNPYTLILVSKIQHGNYLQSKIENSFFVHYKISSKEEQANLIKFRSGELVLIASSVYDAGISINEIENIIIANAGRSFTKCIQKIGRGMRKNKTHKYVIIHDFLDNHSKILHNQALQRIKYYKEEGFCKIHYV